MLPIDFAGVFANEAGSVFHLNVDSGFVESTRE
jgi:hypothetical protein